MFTLPAAQIGPWLHCCYCYTLLACSCRLLHCGVPGCSDCSSAVVLEMHACVGRDQHLCCLLFPLRHQHICAFIVLVSILCYLFTSLYYNSAIYFFSLIHPCALFCAFECMVFPPTAPLMFISERWAVYGHGGYSWKCAYNALMSSQIAQCATRDVVWIISDATYWPHSSWIVNQLNFSLLPCFNELKTTYSKEVLLYKHSLSWHPTSLLQVLIAKCCVYISC